MRMIQAKQQSGKNFKERLRSLLNLCVDVRTTAHFRKKGEGSKFHGVRAELKARFLKVLKKKGSKPQLKAIKQKVDHLKDDADKDCCLVALVRKLCSRARRGGFAVFVGRKSLAFQSFPLTNWLLSLGARLIDNPWL